MACEQADLLRAIAVAVGAQSVGLSPAPDRPSFGCLGTRHLDDYVTLWQRPQDEDRDPQDFFNRLLGGLE